MCTHEWVWLIWLRCLFILIWVINMSIPKRSNRRWCSLIGCITKLSSSFIKLSPMQPPMTPSHRVVFVGMSMLMHWTLNFMLPMSCGLPIIVHIIGPIRRILHQMLLDTIQSIGGAIHLYIEYDLSPQCPSANGRRIYRADDSSNKVADAVINKPNCGSCHNCTVMSSE